MDEFLDAVSGLRVNVVPSPETNSSHLKMIENGWFPIGISSSRGPFSGAIYIYIFFFSFWGM